MVCMWAAELNSSILVSDETKRAIIRIGAELKATDGKERAN